MAEQLEARMRDSIHGPDFVSARVCSFRKASGLSQSVDTDHAGRCVAGRRSCCRDLDRAAGSCCVTMHAGTG